MEDIATEAGVTKPILYRHFGDKGGMYEAIARRTARLLQDRLEVALDAAEGPRAKLSATVEAFLAAVEERPEVYRFLLHRAAAERPEVTQAVGDFTHQLAGRFATVLHEQFARFGLEVGPRRPGGARHDRCRAPGQRLVAVHGRQRP
jgi:AcrR family transcriptional regulator